MKIIVIGQPTYQVEFTRTLVAALALLANSHYDSACRALTSVADEPNKVNGLLTILDQSFYMLDQDELDYVITFRELDLLAKVCEMCSTLQSENNRAVVRQFALCARRAVDLASAAYTGNKWQFVVHDEGSIHCGDGEDG